MKIIALIIQLIAGAIGGNIAGNVLKDYNLGATGNSVAGIIGGGIGGQILAALLGGAGTAAATSGGGIGGAILMAIVGLIRKAMGKRSSRPPGRRLTGILASGVVGYSRLMQLYEGRHLGRAHGLP